MSGRTGGGARVGLGPSPIPMGEGEVVCATWGQDDPKVQNNYYKEMQFQIISKYLKLSELY